MSTLTISQLKQQVEASQWPDVLSHLRQGSGFFKLSLNGEWHLGIRLQLGLFKMAVELLPFDFKVYSQYMDGKLDGQELAQALATEQHTFQTLHAAYRVDLLKKLQATEETFEAENQKCETALQVAVATVHEVLIRYVPETIRPEAKLVTEVVVERNGLKCNFQFPQSPASFLKEPFTLDRLDVNQIYSAISHVMRLIGLRKMNQITLEVSTRSPQRVLLAATDLENTAHIVQLGEQVSTLKKQLDNRPFLAVLSHSLRTKFQPK